MRRANSQIMQQSGAKIEGLEGLRGLMAVWVVLGHVGNYFGYYLGASVPVWAKLFLLTNVPVNIFIALSGFVIVGMLHRKPPRSYKEYFLGRFRRIFPIYIFALLIALLLFRFRFESFFMAPWRTSEQLSEAYAKFNLVSSDILEHIGLHSLMLHGLVPDTALPFSAYAILAPAWSLSLEWQFYLFAPLIFVLIVKSDYSFLLLVGALGVFGLILPIGEYGFTPAFFFLSWTYFALGWWCAVLVISPLPSDRKSVLLRVSQLCVILISMLLLSSDMRADALALGIWLVAFLSCCFPVGWGMRLQLLRRFLELRLIVAVGKRSYSLYLLHVLVIDVIGYVLIKLGILIVPSIHSFALLFGLTLVCGLSLSWLTYSQIEERFIRGVTTVPAFQKQ